MDGVLADTVEAHYQAWRAFYAERGGAITREQLYATFGMANPEILRLWLGNELPEEMILALAAHKETLFRQAAKGNVKLFPGVLDWLQRARARGYRQAVASSGEMANIVAIVSALEIGNYFDALVSGALLPRCKPDPAVFNPGRSVAGCCARRLPDNRRWYCRGRGSAARRHPLPGCDEHSPRRQAGRS
jgi:beta-phosphoglucomutase-like phosphatase (HAD superfamily)